MSASDSHTAWIYRDEDWPEGMLCETCEQPFRHGDEIRGNFVSMFDDGTPVMGEAKCPRCWEAESDA